ncbi:MAG: helix-turn-helix transcriptional regulator [Gammaproteobacteria bacterium]
MLYFSVELLGLGAMHRFDRIFKLHNLLQNRRTPISMAELKRELQCSRATVARIIDEMQGYLCAPVEYDRNRNGYLYNRSHGEHTYELPGLWFSADELHGLLICQHLLNNIGPGILQDHIKHLQSRIDKLLSLHPEAAKPKLGNVKFLAVGSRRLQDSNHFLPAATALFGGRRLSIDYRARSNNEKTRRDVSPQNLIFYRDNWYLDAWCHLRNELRIFALDKIETAEVLDEEAINLPEEQLHDYFATSYGIFSGPAEHTAVLAFSAERARWIADEHWHPKLQTRFLDDGRFELSIPFNDHRELLMDILKYGADVEVMEPDFLAAAVAEQIEKMRYIY